MSRLNLKSFSTFLLVPIAVFFLSCCCLQDEAKAASSVKSKCGACPKTQSQNTKTSTHDDCPHAKIKAVKDAHGFELQLVKYFSLSIVSADVVLSGSKIFLVPQLTAPPIHPSLYFHNPILRV